MESVPLILEIWIQETGSDNEVSHGLPQYVQQVEDAMILDIGLTKSAAMNTY